MCVCVCARARVCVCVCMRVCQNRTHSFQAPGAHPDETKQMIRVRAFASQGHSTRVWTQHTHIDVLAWPAMPCDIFSCPTGRSSPKAVLPMSPRYVMFPTRTAVCIGDMKPWLVSLASILTHNASSFSLAVCVCGYSIGVCKRSETRRGKASYGKRHSMGRGVREKLG